MGWGVSTMRKSKLLGKTTKAPSDASIRASISFPPGLYTALEQLAVKKKVSVAWVVRDATERYLADESEPQRRKKGQ